MHSSVAKYRIVMEKRRINIVIAGRKYELDVSPSEEEILRRVGKKIGEMIKEYEASFDVKDKQDVLAMCALTLGTDAEVNRLANEKNMTLANERVQKMNTLLDEI